MDQSVLSETARDALIALQARAQGAPGDDVLRLGSGKARADHGDDPIGAFREPGLTLKASALSALLDRFSGGREILETAVRDLQRAYALLNACKAAVKARRTALYAGYRRASGSRSVEPNAADAMEALFERFWTARAEIGEIAGSERKPGLALRRNGALGSDIQTAADRLDEAFDCIARGFAALSGVEALHFTDADGLNRADTLVDAAMADLQDRAIRFQNAIAGFDLADAFTRRIVAMLGGGALALGLPPAAALEPLTVEAKAALAREAWGLTERKRSEAPALY